MVDLCSRGVELDFTRLGMPTENGQIVSFRGQRQPCWWAVCLPRRLFSGKDHIIAFNDAANLIRMAVAFNAFAIWIRFGE